MGLKTQRFFKMEIAWVFPGQGSQKVGMAKEVIDLKDAKQKFNYASEIFERDLYRICEENSSSVIPNNDLSNTKNTQICLFLVESILVDSLKEKGYKPNYLAGHSLGEITALYAAEVLSFDSCVSLIKVRSELMSNAPDGSMAALIGFNRDELNVQVNQINDLVIANDNSSSQVVLSGKKEALENISTKIKCKRFIHLNVSGAFHSHLMSDPANKFSEYLDTLIFQKPIFPIISNSNPTLSQDSVELKLRLKQQMCNGVRWRETMDLMSSKAPNNLHLIEVGPSNVLGGLAKRHLKNAQISQVSSSNNLSY